MASPTFAITGATGFVGSRLIEDLRKQNIQIIEIGRHPSSPAAQWINTDLQSDFEITERLRGVNVVLHLAARAHVMHETAENPETLYRRMNFTATQLLAKQAAVAGVKRFVFLSSVKAVGEETHGQPWTESSTPKPEDIYGQTKLEAEIELQKICRDAGRMEFTILRSPLVYGPGVRANFLSLIRAVDRTLPLPFGLTRNKRSLVALPNLTSALYAAATHAKAANQVFFVRDEKTLSTAELIREIAAALKKPARLLPIPLIFLKLLGLVTGKQAQIKRLIGDLEIDPKLIRTTLSWNPPLSTQEALRETASWYRSLQKKNRN